MYAPLVQRTRLLSALASVAVAVLASACATTSTQTAFPAPHRGDGGIVIAQSTLVPGVSAAGGTGGESSDCFGPGLGVEVSGSTTGDKFIFDTKGNPCDAAEVVYDGRTAAGQRQADPTISLNFRDSLGAIPPAQDRHTRKAIPFDAIPVIWLNSRLISATLPPTPEAADPLLKTLNKWRAADQSTVQRSAEADISANRELTRMVRLAQENSSSSAATLLAAKLRERERDIAEEQRRHQETLARAEANRAETTAARDAWQQDENRLTSELEAAKARAAQFEELAGHLKADQSRKEQAYQDRIGTLSTNLKVAEAQADASRRTLILQAAAKVAEAASLAKAAQLDTEQSQLGEASRLHAEANELMDKVLAARAEPADTIEPAAGPKAPVNLNEVPVVLQAKERTLPDILAEVLQQAAPQAGAWRADWQLSAKAQPLLKEKWSLTAEATVGQILENLVSQVKQAGFTLKFTPFAQSRLLVITDTPVSAR